MKRISLSAVVAVLGSVLTVLTVLTAPASAAGAGPGPAPRVSSPITAYSSIPTTLPGSVASAGFEALGLSEFGDYVGLAHQGPLDSLTVTLVSGACQFRPG